MTGGTLDLLRDWDGLAVVKRYDRETGSWIFIALHDATRGMMVGGCRMKTYSSPEEAMRDAMRLAEGMTYKWAAIGLPYGGGKSVLAVPHPLEGAEREGLLRRFGQLLESLRGTYATGVDMGTTPADMDVIAEESRHVMGHGATGSGTEDPGPYTALGVLAGIRATVAALDDTRELAGQRVLIQGAGDVGAPLAQLLHDEGAELLISDVDETRARELAGEVGGTVIPPDEVYDTECDIFAPCAVGAILNAETIPRLRCRAVAGSANNQLDVLEDAALLHERGILYAPDYIINAGGAIAFAMMNVGSTQEEIRERILEIERSLDDVFAEASETGESPVHGARRVARRALVEDEEPAAVG